MRLLPHPNRYDIVVLVSTDRADQQYADILLEQFKTDHPDVRIHRQLHEPITRAH
ncbi:MAG TPA: hypothetical protein VMT30_01245 [Candidatus Saccharimonadia bacterium]|nr:hypothetical protein [Candidatus Saccharimonadia bacterium]